jgi:hypothetical protein
VLESSDADSVVQAHSALIQKGAERFLEEYFALYSDFPPSALTSRVWANEFYRLVTAPTRAEADLLGELTHCDAAGNTKRRLPLAPQVSTNVPDELAVALERSFWKAGFRIRNEMAT